MIWAGYNAGGDRTIFMLKTKRNPVSVDSVYRKRVASGHRQPLPSKEAAGSPAAISDSQKRAFLKAVGVLGVGAVIYSALPKRASAMIFGSAPGGGGMSDSTIATTLSSMQDQLTSVDATVANLATEETAQEIKTAVSAIEAQGPTQTVQEFYAANPGQTFIVAGPKVTGSDPPVMSQITQQRVDAFVALGIPMANIVWNVVGESDNSTVAISSVPGVYAYAGGTQGIAVVVA